MKYYNYFLFLSLLNLVLYVDEPKEKVFYCRLKSCILLLDWKNTKIMVGPQHYQWRHQCDQCDYKNKNHFNLKYHLKCHTRNQRFKCPLCSFSSNFKFYTDRHLELHHVNIPEYLQVN